MKKKTQQPSPLPRCEQDLRNLPLPFDFATSSTNQPEEKGPGGFHWEAGDCGEGFVTPAGIGVSIPPRDKSLPSSLQSKLGSTKKCIFYFLVFIFLFCFCWKFYSVLFCCWSRVQCFYPPPFVLYQVYSTGKDGAGIGLCFNLLSVQCCWCVEKQRLCSPVASSRGHCGGRGEAILPPDGGNASQSLFGVLYLERVGVIKALPTQDLRESVTAARGEPLNFILSLIH